MFVDRQVELEALEARYGWSAPNFHHPLILPTVPGKLSSRRWGRWRQKIGCWSS